MGLKKFYMLSTGNGYFVDRDACIYLIYLFKKWSTKFEHPGPFTGKWRKDIPIAYKLAARLTSDAGKLSVLRCHHPCKDRNYREALKSSIKRRMKGLNDY